MSTCTDIRRLFGLLSLRRRWQLAGLFLLTLLGALAEVASLGAVVPFLALLANPDLLDRYPVVEQVMSIFGISASQRVLAAALLFAVLTVFAAAIRMLLLRVSSRYIYAVGADFGDEVYRRTIYQTYLYHVSHNSSEVISGINRVSKVVNGVINPLMQAAVAVIITFAILLILLRIDLMASMVAMGGFVLLYGVASFFTRRRLRANSEIIQRNDKKRVQAIQEALGGIRDVIIDGTHQVYLQRFMGFNREIREAEALNLFLSGAPRFLVESFGMILIVAMACWLSMRPEGIAGAIPVLGVLAMGAQRLMPQLQLIFNAWSAINSNRAQLESTLQRLTQPIAEQYLTAPIKGDMPASGDVDAPLITLDQVSYRYSGDGPRVLDALSLDIARGARIGFVGKTGSGKSTLIDLIMGLLAPQQGQIRIQGQVLTDETRPLWQQYIAHVPQSIYLIDATIAQNIALGVPMDEINWPRLHCAARRAQVNDFILDLPQQYKTQVGERGVRLSGGQRQRIGLARALYKKATVLILDEATSALDDRTEAEVIKTLDELGNDVTVLMIAHRLSTLRSCDCIVQLEPGGRVRYHSSTDVYLSARSAEIDETPH